MTASEFWETLDRLGLSQYHDGLVQEAFDSWDVLADITEKDLDALGVKLGHRRVLQRAIADYRRDRSQPAVLVEPTVEHIAAVPKLDCSPHITSSGPDAGPNASSRATSGNKRKYRRHPKPDENAPDRPPSAYVLFSNQVREHLKGKDLSFTEIAKTVGERWQVLAPDDKATYESRSQAMKDRYYAELAEYKKTQDYAHYQNYLEDFKAKHEPTNGKRLKEDKNASPNRRSSDERTVSSPDHREGCASSIEQHGGIRRSSIIGSPRITNTVDWRPMTLSNHTSPETTTPDSNSRSPRHNKPAFASINVPQSSTPALMHSRRTSAQSGSPMHNHPMAISTSMAYGYHPMLATRSSCNSPPTGHPRRPTLASESSLPSLRHSESLSSGSVGSAGSPLSTAAPNVPSALSRSIPNRELPPPFPSSRPSGLAPSLPPMKTPGSPSRYSPLSSGLATLLRAGEHLASNGPDLRSDSHDSRHS